MKNKQIIDDLKNLARIWNCEKIRYCISHGLESYPKELGRDIDVFVEKDSKERILKISYEFLKNNGYKVTVPPNPWGAVWLFAFKEKDSIQIDFITSLAWGPVNFIQKIEIDENIEEFEIDYWVTFVKSVIMKLLGGSIPVIPNIYLDTSKVQENLKLLIGKKAAEILTSILESFNPSSMKKMVSFLKIRIIFHVTIRYPLNIFKRFIPWVINEIRPYVNRTAPIIALVGPDGTGKSTIAKQIINYTPDFFTGLIIRHSRPRLLPDPHELFFLESNNKKIETKPNRKRGNFHFIRLTYYAIDYFLGNFLLDCFDSSRLKIVVYDRCALDMFVDPLRYALKSNMGVMFIWRLLPKPDRIIFLHNDSVLIYKRKQELSLSEIQKQNELWLDLKDKGLVNNVITADNKNNILLEINQIIIDAFLEKNNYIEA